MDGMFQVIKINGTLVSPDSFSIVGTAFIISTLSNNPNEHYLLTAYHCISESYVNNKMKEIRVCGNDDVQYEVEVVHPECAVSYNGYIYNDFALLKIISQIKYEEYEVGDVPPLPTECYIRGAPLHFSKITRFTPFEGKIFMPEFEKDTNEKILVFDIRTKTVFDTEFGFPKNQQDILGGLSGSPILTKHNNKLIVVGIFARIHIDGSASKCYGVPISNVVTTCLLPNKLSNGLILKKHIEKKSEIVSEDAQVYMDTLLKDPLSFSLEDCDSEVEIWNTVSNQFYHGFAMDDLFFKVISSTDFLRYSYDAQIVIRYCLARLLFKRGKRKSACEQFHQIQMIDSHLSRNVQKRISALISSRMAVEFEIKNPQLELDQIRHSGETIENLKDVNSDYIANESASTISRGLMNFFGQMDLHDTSPSIKYAMKEIFNQHSLLLKKHPLPLQKQDVVNTALSWLMNIWEIGDKINIEKLQEEALTGFKQAMKRRNTIFHIQSLVAYSVSLLIIDSKGQALTGLFVVSLLMRTENLNLTHEGISQLLKFIKEQYINVFILFKLFFNLCFVNEKAFLEKASIYCTDIPTRIISFSVSKAHFIFDEFYKPLGKDIYLGEVNSTIEFL